MQTRSRIRRNKGAAMCEEAHQWARRQRRVTRMGTGPVIHSAGALLCSAVIGLESKCAPMLQHDVRHASVLTSACVMRGNVTRVKECPCCRTMHSTHAVLMSARAKWGEMQCNYIVLKGRYSHTAVTILFIVVCHRCDGRVASAHQHLLLCQG